MKKILVCMLALCLMLPLALAEEPAIAPLDAKELNEWTEGLVARAISDQLEVKETPEGLAADGRGYTVYPRSKDLSPDTMLSGAVIDSESIEVQGLTGPRTLIVTQSAGAVLSAFPNDNETLQGTEQAAVLYLRGTLPGVVQTGTLMRNGQDITLLEYSVYTPDGDKVDRSGVQFTIDKGAVTAIRYFGAEDVPMAEAVQSLQQLSQLQEETGYFAYTTQNPQPMQREDLVFSGNDFLDLTPEMATAAFGSPEASEKVEDSNGDQLETLQWPDMFVTFVYNKEGKFLRTDRVVVHGNVEGPRGVRIGDDMLTVLSRFENTSETLNAESLALYGSADKPEEPYGQLLQEAGTSTLYYSVPVKDGTVLFTCRFINEQVVEMSLSHM